MPSKSVIYGFRASRVVIISMSLLLLSGSLNVLLSIKVLSQKQKLVAEREWGFGIGRIAQPLKAQNLEGKTTTISFSDGELPTVLYVFSPQCIWSTRNINNVQTLVAKTNGKYRFFGLALSDNSLDTYILEHKFSFPTFKMPDKCSRDDLRIVGTPQTIVISMDGQIVKNWYGEYSGNIAKEVEDFFDLTVPRTIKH